MALLLNLVTYCTLTQRIQQDMKDCLRKLKTVIDVGFVGGSDANKIREQLD